MAAEPKTIHQALAHDANSMQKDNSQTATTLQEQFYIKNESVLH